MELQGKVAQSRACVSGNRINSASEPLSGYPPFLHHDSFDDGFRLVHPAGQQPGDHSTDDRGHPKQPELGDVFTTGKQCRAGAARRVDRGIGDRDRDKMDQGQGEPDRNAGKAGGSTL